ncbi:MAG TPA: Ohr family peroxiredoxin [Pseudoxanthomonas sp.]|nr:Ohr family peroxiredoxin [Pseudoxanthomonas sp.]
MRRLRRPPTSLLDKFHGDEVQELYTGIVVVTGGEAAHGRASGIARSQDGELELHLRLPKELGGEGGGTNPEQLLAAGYAACFHGVLSLLAERHGLAIPDATITASVTFGRDPVDGLFLLSSEIRVALPGVDRAVAEGLLRNAERNCPYTKMFRQGIESVVVLAT